MPDVEEDVHVEDALTDRSGSARRVRAMIAAGLAAALALALPWQAPPAGAAVSADELARYEFAGLATAEAGTPVPDTSGNGHDATILGAGASVDGDALRLPGGAADSDAAFVELPTGLFDGLDTVSVSMWLQNDTGPGNYSAMYIGTSPTSAELPFPEQYFILNPANTAGLFKAVLTGSTNTAEPWMTEVGISPTVPEQGVPGPLTDSSWAMYTAVITPTSITGYLDDELIGTVTTSRTVADFGTDLLGYLGRSSYGDIFYQGGIRDVAIFSGELTESDVAEIYGEAVTDEQSVANAIAALDLPNVDDVRGNITLPTSGSDGTSIEWASADEGVITASGEVTRPAAGEEPVSVQLTATVSKGMASDTKVFDAVVQPLPGDLDFEGYFMPYFAGESTTVGEEMYFSVSEGNDPRSWERLNNGDSVIQSTMGEQGIRDPYILRSPDGDRFYMISTDLNMFELYGGSDFGSAQESGSRRLNVWESNDLVNWSDQRSIIVSSAYAGNTWAPEATWDEEAGEYIVYWASNLYDTTDPAARNVADSYNRMMYVTTRDFVTFSEPQEWIDVKRGDGRGMIDVNIVKDGDTYYRFVKDEQFFDIRQEKSTDLRAEVEGSLPATDSTPGWQLIAEHIGQGQPNPWGGTYTQGEGPSAFRDNEDPDHWYLVIDQPSYHGGEGYMLFESDDIASGDWTSIIDAQLPENARHGTVLPITAAEHAAVLEAFPNDDPAEYTITVDDEAVGAEIADTMYGVFYEDINWAADGGLYAELVRNRSFEYLPVDEPSFTGLTGWGTTSAEGGTGTVDTVNDDARLNERNRTYLQVGLDNADAGTFGVFNSGYSGIAVADGSGYDFSVFARTTAEAGTPVTVVLQNQLDEPISDELTIEVGGDGWVQYTGTLTATETTDAGTLHLYAGGQGTLRLDMVSLFPQDTYQGHENGLRRDLAEKIDALDPSFLRFPGGCLVNVNSHLEYTEEAGFPRARSYQWKDTVGPVEERATNSNFWGYNQSYGLGYYEYFQFAEDLGAMPVPVVPAIMNGCGQGPIDGQWNNPDVVDRHVQDALDLIEFANGPVDTEWGGLRAEMGHPEPFGMDRLEVGNEENFPVEFMTNFVQFRDAINAAYPDIMVISNSGPDDEGANFDLHWEQNIAEGVEMVDEHYYNSPTWFLQNNDRYDSYDRNGPKVWVGEYASLDNRWENALAEAAFMTGLERNADVVEMASYAPLLANVANVDWDPDLIWFDNDESWGSTSYEVQKLFMNNVGDRVIPTVATGDVIQAEPVGGTVGLSTWLTAAEYDDVRVTDPEGGVIFEDDFEDGNADGWSSLVDNGAWSVVDGAYSQSSTTAENTLVAAPDFEATDYDLEVTATKTAGAEGFLVGFGVKDSGNYYWWNLGGWNNTRHVVEKATGGAKQTLLAEENVSLDTDVAYNLRVEVRGTHVELYLDGELWGSFDDNQVLEPFAQVMTEDDATGDLILKVVNAQSADVVTHIDLGAHTVQPEAEMTVLQANPNVENTRTSTPVAPVTTTIDGIAPQFTRTFPANSVTFIRVATGEVVEPDTVRPVVSLVSPSDVGPFGELEVQVDATDEVGLQRIVANVYQDGVLVKSTQSAMDGVMSGSHVATVGLPDGDYLLKYNAQDLAGNISQTGTFEFSIGVRGPQVPVLSGEFSYKDVSGSFTFTCVDQRVGLTVEATASQQRGNKFRLTASAPKYGEVTSEVLKMDQTQSVLLPEKERKTRPASTLTVSLDRVGDSFSTEFDLPRVNCVQGVFLNQPSMR